jgi:Domain of unknown function (DUF5658)
VEFHVPQGSQQPMKNERSPYPAWRKKPTPGLSRYIFFGRRKGFRRRTDQQKGGYVDRYSLSLFIILMAILFLNFADANFTMVILDHGGEELNPVVGSAIEAFGTKYWIWKFCIVSLSLILLCIHSKFKRVEGIILAVGSIYFLVVIYQLLLIIN